MSNRQYRTLQTAVNFFPRELSELDHFFSSFVSQEHMQDQNIFLGQTVAAFFIELQPDRKPGCHSAADPSLLTMGNSSDRSHDHVWHRWKAFLV
jgi:hypothetical protein